MADDAIFLACGSCAKSLPDLRWKRKQWDRQKHLDVFYVLTGDPPPGPFLMDGHCNWTIRGIHVNAFLCSEFSAVWSKAKVGVGYLDRPSLVMYSQLPGRTVQQKLADIAKDQSSVLPALGKKITPGRETWPVMYRQELEAQEAIYRAEKDAEMARHARANGDIERHYRESVRAIARRWERRDPLQGEKIG